MSIEKTIQNDNVLGVKRLNVTLPFVTDSESNKTATLKHILFFKNYGTKHTNLWIDISK